MKRAHTLILLFATCMVPLLAGPQEAPQKSFPLQRTPAFKVGESITYRIHYGVLDAGVATISVKEQTRINNRPVYHMVGTGRSVGMVEWFFRTRDVYETYMDTQTLLPLKFLRDVDEGGYIIKRDITFNRTNNTARDAILKKDTLFKVPANVHDIFSVFYYMRSLNVTDIAKGDVLEIPVFLDHEIFPFKVKFVGRDMVKTDFGRIKCLKFVPVVQQGRVFKEEDDMHIWISDDNMHIPIRIKSELLVGSIKVDVTGYKGLNGTLVFEK